MGDLYLSNRIYKIQVEPLSALQSVLADAELRAEDQAFKRVA